MEKLASSLQFPCKYTTSGCTLNLTFKDKTDHESECI